MRNHLNHAIARDGGGSTNSQRTADAVVRALESLHAELSAVVGAQAAASLCAHALHRTRPAFHWQVEPAAQVSAAVLQELRQDLSQRAPSESLLAGEALLVALVDHLVSLIGEPLINRMLQSAWTSPDASQTSQENL